MNSIQKILILLFCTTAFLSAQSIKIDSESGSFTRGLTYKLPILTDIQYAVNDTIQIEISYSSSMLSLDSLSLINNDLLIGKEDRAENATFDIANDRIATYTFIKKSTKLNDTISYINLLALAGAKESIKISPIKLKVNSNVITKLNSVITSINFTDQVVQQNDLRVERFHPNPFSSQSTLPFTIDANSKVRLLIYSINGKQIADIPEYSEIDYKLFDTKNNELKDFNLLKGTYFLKLYLNNFNFSGAFTLVFVAGAESKTINFMITK